MDRPCEYRMLPWPVGPLDWDACPHLPMANSGLPHKNWGLLYLLYGNPTGWGCIPRLLLLLLSTSRSLMGEVTSR